MAHGNSPARGLKAFAKVLRATRERALLTQEQLAQRSGVSVRAIRNLEAGRVARPRGASLRLLAEALGLDGREWTDDGDEPSRPARLVPAQLPADVARFTGRGKSLEFLDSLVASNVDGPWPAVVIAGAAGIGKTALATHWAHRVAGRFPDGQLYVSLQGHGPGAPASPLQALSQLLRSLGLDAERVPVNVDEAAGMYRSLLMGQRVLVVLDNAVDAAQVRPLLPGASGCLVVITSRDRLGGLVASHGAHRLILDALDPDEAVALLTDILGPTTTTAEADAIADLAQLCAYLPLALRVAAANVAGSDLSVADHVAELRGGDLLAGLEVPGDPQTAVRAAFDQSYDRLNPDARRLFRLATLNPGSTVSVASAAALTRMAPESVHRLLNGLVNAHLLESPAPGRFGYHDLLLRYAHDRCRHDDSADDRRSALHRLYAWYLHNAHSADELVYPGMVRLPVPQADTLLNPFDDHEDALAWLHTEWDNLTAAITSDGEDRPLPTVWLIADALRAFLWAHRYTIDHLAIATAALHAAKIEANPAAQAATELSLGDAHQCVGNYPQAITHYTASIDLARRAEWPAVEAASLLHLGNIAGDLGHLDQAIDHQTAALALFREAGAPKGIASALGNLGNLHWELGSLDAAAEYQDEALGLLRKIENRVGEAASLDNLGEIALARGQIEVAEGHLNHALTLQREVGDRYGEAYSLGCLAAVHLQAGRVDGARDLADAALNLAADIGDPRTQAEAHNTLGGINLRQGHHPEAIDQHRRALKLAREAGTRSAEVSALLGLAATHHDAGDDGRASDYARQALNLATTVGYRLLEAEARRTVAEIDPPALA